MKKLNIFRHLVVFVLFFGSFSVCAQEDDLERINHGLKFIEENYAIITREFEEGNPNSDSLKGGINVLIVYRDSLFTLSTELTKLVSKATIDLTALGPVPNEEDPTEPENISNKRKKLNDQINNINGSLSTCNDLIGSVGKLIKQISDYRVNVFVSGISKRSTSFFTKALWLSAWSEFKTFAKSVRSYYSDFWSDFWLNKKTGNILLLFTSLLLAFLVPMIPQTKVYKKFSGVIDTSYLDSVLRRQINGLREPILKFIIVLVSSVILYWGALEINLISEESKSMVQFFIIDLSVIVFIWYFAKSVFKSEYAIFGKIKCAPGTALESRYLFIGMFLIFFMDRIFIQIFDFTYAGINLITVQSFLLTSAFALMFYIFVSPKRWVYVLPESNQKKEPIKDESSLKRKRDILEGVLLIGRGIGIALFLAMVLEYIDLANFVFHRVVLLTTYLILYGSVRDVFLWIISEIIRNNPSETTKNQNTIENKDTLNFWLNTIVNFILVLLGIPAFLFAIGMDPLDIKYWIHVLLTGFKIGGETFSLKNIFSGISMFLLIILITRWATSMINSRLIEHSNIDSGVRNSMVTILNYLGVVIALFTAVPLFGFNFSKITVVVGALSVGIGFGLQNIVKDYVSGLLLLIERPIKLGDWVVVSNGQGYVKEIKGRVTVVETFDKLNLIVPNSDLVNLPIQNWFYGNKKGRVVVDIGVAYSSDPELVKELLIKCANDHPTIVSSPKPNVIWDGFGDSTLNFQLRAYVNNSDISYLVKSDLHFAIYKIFRENGISIPFPQRDIHVESPLDKKKDELSNKTRKITKDLKTESKFTKQDAVSKPTKKSAKDKNEGSSS